eukprot:scaffold494137_cov17-Prasinocladus_malaysianus.AAC.1
MSTYSYPYDTRSKSTHTSSTRYVTLYSYDYGGAFLLSGTTWGLVLIRVRAGLPYSYEYSKTLLVPYSYSWTVAR